MVIDVILTECDNIRISISFKYSIFPIGYFLLEDFF